ncbi:ATP-binding protein [Nocardiopsis gilva YIM 90087]|uniref:histidine kinase n=1 Tax=Nocardiopsis gilva YIM 90087 TaxID=1235441 RepID=A0A223S1D4_9ACTN|nr:ATP-binding protein [Nocardiopsis gilva]ASU81914.1 ATP-binding protein [Nocardiopsis gilva YIM 90087]
MEHYLLPVAFVIAVAGLIALAALLVRQRLAADHLSRRNAELSTELRLRDEELRYLVTIRLPKLAEALHDRPVTASGPLHDRTLAGTAFAKDVGAVVDLYTDAVRNARSRAEDSAKSTLRAMMRTVQSLANEQQVVLSNMQGRHDDPDVLEDLLKIDHMNAQLGRRAQATAVLCGSWPGQQRSSSPLTDVVRGATSRIRDYLRIRLRSSLNTAVTGRAVEPVVLTVAELLDNAARHSQPNTTVEVNFQPTHNGVAVTIDDAGVAMDAEELAQAERMLSGQRTPDIHRLGTPPQVGFAVAGVLAARYGFSVSVDTRSPYGGVRAVVFLPSSLLTDGAQRPPIVEESTKPVAAAAPTPPPEPPGHDGADTPRTADAGLPSGLPRRRRLEAAEPPPAEKNAAPVADQSGRPAQDVAAGMGAWQRGTRSGRADDAPPESEGKDPRP